MRLKYTSCTSPSWPPSAKPLVPAPAVAVAVAADDGLLAQLLGGNPVARTALACPAAASAVIVIDAVIRSIVAPHIVPDDAR